MEKWLVVLGIWAMCATCAVLFIRGATGVRRDEAPPVAPRMNSTAQVAHIAQMPNTTNHFSISPVL